MPLLSYEGVEVDLPANLAGIRFEFTAGSLTIHCRNFTGDVVLSKPAEASSKPSSPSKKRTIDLSASDDDDEADAKRPRPNFLNEAEQTFDDDDEVDAKRPRPNFLNEAEQTLLLAKMSDDKKAKSKEKTKDKEPDAEVETAAEQATDSADSSESTTGKKGKKTKKGTKKTKESVDSFFSPEPKQTSRKATPDSNMKKSKATKTSPGKSIKDLMIGPPKPKLKVVASWEMMEALGTAPPGRWGHTATKISDERVVVYGGTDDEERTLGDLHVFDMKTHRWMTPLNCETITRSWHDAVYLSTKNLILVFGGERNSDAEGELDILSDILVLDTECFLWYPPAIRGTPPPGKSGHTCTALGDEMVVFGGSGGRNRQTSVHILDSDEWNWKAVKVEGKPPTARTYHSAVALGDDKIVYFGGNASSKSFNDVHVLQKAKKSGDVVWSWDHPNVTGLPPQEHTGHSATLVSDGKILIFGGWDPQGVDVSAPTQVFNDAFLLDTKTWEWQPANFSDEGSVEASRELVGHGAVLDGNGRVHLFGGQNGMENRVNDICTITLSQKQDEKPKQSETTASTLENE
ncbi:Rab9 effector protein [Phytophthora megakarya]|uniref:Rab9 effector protein n=1 Tax=Phytophthora megakarya TaxID=4795 RepID=A0A225WQD9_9STRA|nr:Rab9 effector protein [Phytophthora megakarya]